MFMLFTGHNYYPGGGWSDFRGFFGSLESAREAAKARSRDDWYQVVGTTTCGIGLMVEGNIRDL